ncbi:unnamed protein product [Rhizoctonia solani]|uniref:Uncharacterized protein n=1 Tax=Rhizoctonia solani TaxID=456999 RepID=A0A8H3GU54_9AGAM|nr:unnamed protein product [Rhizoctonia solani]
MHFSRCIKSLTISSSCNRLTELGLAVLEPCMTHLTELREFRCDLELPSNVGVVRLVQVQCPQLETVRLTILGLDLGTPLGQSQSITLLGFKNLLSYSLSLNLWSKINSERLGPLETLAINCPKLETLKLYLSLNDVSSQGSFTPDILAASFGKATMPSLHTLHICGGVRLNAKSLLGSPTTGSHPFRDFLLRHPLISDLKIECITADHWWQGPDTDPENLACALPSLTHLSAPDFLCAQLVCSTVATRLQHMQVRQSTHLLLGKFDPLPMPMLQGLYIESNRSWEALDIMQLVMPVATGLKDLWFAASVEYKGTQFLELLAHTPNLQTIKMGDPCDNASYELFRKIEKVNPDLKITFMWRWESID